ncbi:G protein-activated inward rectifier potassium channel 4-like [Styela clava]|uniref:G protein-activated inward rectifier potassium channel 4-like n=1 Tax=Styela clava TaxID=7725 RepID=UPI001939280C|nr:G protein-activated inward rectifier potassium channel 4-like [Styela clava]
MSMSRRASTVGGGVQMSAKLAALRGESVEGSSMIDSQMGGMCNVNQDTTKAKSKTKQPDRFMTKTGHCNIRRSAIQMGRMYVTDIFTTLIDLRWKYNIIIFVLVYTAGWSLFGFFWWFVAFIRGDVTAHAMNDTDHNPCVEKVYSYATAFLFFIETETTIGYGKRAITDQCPEAILLFVIQALIGSIVDAFMVGCIFIKLSQPKNRAETLVFSDQCVLTLRDGKYCLMFRVANLRNSLLIQCKIRAKLVKSTRTLEGEFIGLHQDDINVGFDTGADNLFLVTPLIICHEIDYRSPFYNMNAEALVNDKFEIIVILEGMIESTGMICQARTSYLNTEVLWGHRFMPVLFHARDHFSVDHSEFHTTFEVPMSKLSMKKYQESHSNGNSNKNSKALYSTGSA